MNVREKVLQKAQYYIENKNYDLELVRENKVRKPTRDDCARRSNV